VDESAHGAHKNAALSLIIIQQSRFLPIYNQMIRNIKVVPYRPTLDLWSNRARRVMNGRQFINVICLNTTQ